MKTKITIILLAITSIIGYSQTNEFAPIGAKWWYSKYEGNPPTYGYILIESIKDTLINTKTCKVLNKKYFSSIGYVNDWGSEYIYNTNDTVYYFRNNQFYILYNFSSNNNDEWAIYGDIGECENPQSTLRVDSIGFVNISGKSLKYLYTSPADTNSLWLFDDKIIEIIGNLTYLFPLPTCYSDACFGNYGCGLRCYTDTVNEIYFNNDWNLYCDTLIQNIETLKNVTSNFTISPNPIIDKIYINIPLEYQNSKLLIKIINHFGNELFEKEILSQKKIILENNFQSNIYFILIYRENILLESLKIIKIN